MSETPQTSVNSMCLKSINDLLGNSYSIPSYQRGYRWTNQQVEDLLNDINEFEPKNDSFYCLQPLVVKKRIEKNDFEVIDGQQRLTTIKIILAYLGDSAIIESIKGILKILKNKCIDEKNYVENLENKIKTLSNSITIDYETREGSKDFLDNIAIDRNDKDSNIDYYYMSKAYESVKNWFDKKDNDFKDKFREKLLNHAKVIWYETSEKEVIRVFERLNSGKIPLTNAELIKALFLNSSNFIDSNDEKINANELRLRQQEIAMQWDEIEYALQNDEFWLFLNETEKEGEIYSDTRIDFIFDLIRGNDLLEVKSKLEEKCKSKYGNDYDAEIFEKDYSEKIGDDRLKAYRYFNKYFEKNNVKETIEKAWKKVRYIYLTLKEWYNDIELYHYIGFLITEGNSKLSNIYALKENSKRDFLNKIKGEIEKIFKDKKLEEIEYGDYLAKKTLLLHNIETSVQMANKQKESDYKLPVFYKFPFHLYKKEKWDVEHISSQKENDLSTPKDRIEFLLSSYNFIKEKKLKEEIKEKIFKILKKGNCTDEEFKDLHSGILANFDIKKNNPNRKDLDNDKLGNLALLDSKTNRGYKNAIFATKRIWISDREVGRRTYFEVQKEEVKQFHMYKDDKGNPIVAFVPICTKNVFLKSYTAIPSTLLEWTEVDATAYFNNIKETLKDFIKAEESEATNV